MSVGLSIVIATRDRPVPLREVVLLLVSATAPHDGFEVVVVDDGSTVPLALELPPDGPHVRIIRTAGVERSAARNLGARESKGWTLLFVDDDMTVRTDFVVQHARAHVTWPGALVAGAIALPPERLAEPFVAFRQRLESMSTPASGGPVQAPNFCAAGNMSMDRRAFEELGGFDERLTNGEDQDLALRHTARGGRIVFLPAALAIHRDSALDIRRYCRRVEWGSRDGVAFCEAQPGWRDNQERARVNGPVRFLEESALLTVKKLVKSALGRPPITSALFGVTRILEALGARTALERMYSLLLGIHLQRGFRTGLAVRRMRIVAPTRDS